MNRDLERHDEGIWGAVWNLRYEAVDADAQAEAFVFDDGIVVVREAVLRRRFLQDLSDQGWAQAYASACCVENSPGGRPPGFDSMVAALRRCGMFAEDLGPARYPLPIWSVRIGCNLWGQCFLLLRAEVFNRDAPGIPASKRHVVEGLPGSVIRADVLGIGDAWSSGRPDGR